MQKMSARQLIDERIAERELEEDNLAWAKPLVDEGLAALSRGEFITLEEHKARNAARLAALKWRRLTLSATCSPSWRRGSRTAKRVHALCQREFGCGKRAGVFSIIGFSRGGGEAACLPETALIASQDCRFTSLQTYDNIQV